jgi:hypothetical protein
VEVLVALPVDRVSIELSQRCGKACAFCYSRSTPDGDPGWDPADVITFLDDLVANGLAYVSFGGGEPLQYPGLLDVLRATRGKLGRAVTTSGLGLDHAFPHLADVGLEKAHVSIHNPHHDAEVERAVAHVAALEAVGIAAGVNLLVARARLDAATAARTRLHAAGILNDRIVYLPMRGADTPTPREVAAVAGGRFQSMSCLPGCAPSARFASIGWDRTVAWCSYTTTRRPLPTLTAAGLTDALDGLGLRFCGEAMRGQG